MPIYEYQCGACGHLAEVFQKGTASRSPRCPRCGGKTRRIISATAFILKGSGWYVTDYPSRSRKEAMEAEKKGTDKKEGADKKDDKKESPKEKTPPAPAAPSRAGKPATGKRKPSPGS